MPKVALKQKQRKSRNLTLKERIDLEALDKFFLLNEIVLATVPGYSPWPARIIGIDGATIKVEFFGTGERCALKSKLQLKTERKLNSVHCIIYFENLF